MNTDERTFDDCVTIAADCLVTAHGVEGAIAELQRRRSAGKDNGRVNEALAYLKRKEADE